MHNFTIDPKSVLNSLFYYLRLPYDFWDNGHSELFNFALSMIVCGLSTIGYWVRIKERITVFEIFLSLYIVFLVIWTGKQGMRFFIPIIPLYIFYALVGVKKIKFLPQGREIEKFVFAILMIAIFAAYAGKYTTVDYGPIREGVSKRETIELFDYIRKHTKKEDVFIFKKPRVLSLYTGRNASVYHEPNDDKDLWRYFHEIGATYLIVGPVIFYNAFLHLFVEKYKNNFEEVYANPDFKVYKIIYRNPQ